MLLILAVAIITALVMCILPQHRESLTAADLSSYDPYELPNYAVNGINGKLINIKLEGIDNVNTVALNKDYAKNGVQFTKDDTQSLSSKYHY